VSSFTRLTEPILRVPRALRTVAAVSRFDRSYSGEASTNGDENWRMRSAMDIHPQAGRLISRVGVRKSRGGVPPWELARTSSFVNPDEILQCVQGLKRDGVYVFDKKLPVSMVESMRASALTVPSIARGLEEAPTPYPRAAPRVGRYDIDEDHTMASHEMQDYCSDPALALIASEYLGQPVIQDQTALWWTTTKGSADAALNAWLFHQDRDRLAFLKFFVYLTDVGPNNGPHTYVRGTQRRVPRSLASDGRKDDDLIRRAGLWDRVISLTGEAGTLMAVDTVGLHKGQPPVIDDRCVLQVEFATSLFGAAPDYPIFRPSQKSRERFAAMPEVLQRWQRSFATQ
jgi:hypothetical protein